MPSEDRIKALELATNYCRDFRFPPDIVLDHANAFEIWLSSPQGWSVQVLQKADLDFIGRFNKATPAQRNNLYRLVDENDIFSTE